MIYRNSYIAMPVSLGTTGLSPIGYVSINGNSFNQITSGVTEISRGWYKVILTNRETSGDIVGLHVEAPGVDSFAMTVITENDYTSGRAGNLDNLNATIASRAPSTLTVAAITQDVWSEVVDDVVYPGNQAGGMLYITNSRVDSTVSSRMSSSFGSTIQTINSKTSALTYTGNDVKATLDGEQVYTSGGATSVTSVNVSSMNAGIINSTVAPNLDVAISSRLASANYTAPDNTSIATALANTQTLTGRLTSTRSTNLDNLNATITSRAPSSLTVAAITQDIWSEAIDDVIYPGGQAGYMLYTTANRVDTTISSRMPSSYAPTVLSINAKTSALSSIGNRVVATLTGETISATSTGDVGLTAGAIQGIWDAQTATLSTNASIGKKLVDGLDVNVSVRQPNAAKVTIKKS